jgi:hypothetical protein
VVLLPPDVRFIDAISAVMSLVMKVKNRYYLDIQNNLTKAVASGFQEEDILHYLGDYIPGYFTVTDSEGQQLQQHTASGFDPNTAVADRLRLPILCMGKVTGYLTSVTNSFLEEHQEMLLKTASHLLSVLVLKKYYVAKIEQKYISGFLSELFEKRLSPDAIVEKAHNYGWNRGDSYRHIFRALLRTKQNEGSRGSYGDYRFPPRGKLFFLYQRAVSSCVVAFSTSGLYGLMWGRCSDT